MFDYFTSSVMFAEQPFERACAAIAEAGLTQVDIWSIAGWCEHIPPHEPEPDWEPIRAALTEHGLTCTGFSLYGSSNELIMHRLPQMRALGGTVLVRGSTPPETSVADFAQSIRFLADRARNLGLTLAIENHGNATIDSIASMVELCERVDHPGLGIALAPIHLHNHGERTEDAIRALGKEKIALFYAWDWGPTAVQNWKDPQEQIPGDGEIEFRPILEALREIGYDKPLCIFAHGVEHKPVAYGVDAIRRGIAYLRGMESSL